MSDTYREWLGARKIGADVMRKSENTDAVDVPYHDGAYLAYCDALTEYDATAPERQRAERAMEFVQQLISVVSLPKVLERCNACPMPCQESRCGLFAFATAARNAGLVENEAGQ